MSFRRLLPSLGQLATFEAAARLGGFTLAARELGVTQAAVSRQIRLLEEELRVELFVRGHRRVDLTPSGAVLAAAVAHGFERIADAIEVIRRPELTEALTVAATVAFSHFWLLPRLSTFRAEHPGVKIRVLSQDAKMDLRAGGVDVLIRYSEPPFPDGEVQAMRADAVFPVCSPGFAAQIAGARLGDLPLIGAEGPDASWLSWRRWSALAGVGRLSEDGALRFSTYTDAVYAAVDGQGVALGWGMLLGQLLEDGRLVRLGAAEAAPPEAFCAVTPLVRARKPAALAFTDWLASRFSEEG
ncbi:LysR substrate-binding domain-containing protein [Rubrimonas cliftonensis]|uniref:Transcriptional regulator, LysR family n=1 Tax=Rubrimonas cliftonensis TaxID=89524 RepID=A0A1H4DZA2_9RHOB|nr:LysR substrate-binding domain-containing protein [Rubrimonas cliftonensis]SEA78091.1 transcriptional regulator, LysR family [Rubrimonas cliftonensis]